jgi:hypothetical protein
VVFYTNLRDATSKSALSGHLGHKNAKSGPFRVKLGLMRHFGLVEDLQGDQLQVSEIGRDILVPERRQEARRKAFMSQTYYKKLIENYAGHQLPPEDAVKTTLHFDYQLPENSAAEAAAAFVESAKLAGLVDPSGRVVLAGAETDEGAAVAEDPAESEREAPTYEAPTPTARSGVKPHGAPESFTRMPASFQIRLDLSGLDADEIIRVLQAMGLADRSEHE